MTSKLEQLTEAICEVLPDTIGRDITLADCVEMVMHPFLYRRIETLEYSEVNIFGEPTDFRPPTQEEVEERRTRYWDDLEELAGHSYSPMIPPVKLLSLWKHHSKPLHLQEQEAIDFLHSIICNK